MSTALFQKKVMESIDLICESRKRVEDRRCRNSNVTALTDTRKDQSSSTVSSEAKKLYEHIKASGIGNPNIQTPTLCEIHGFLSEVTKNFKSPPKNIFEAVEVSKSRGLTLSEILLIALVTEY